MKKKNPDIPITAVLSISTIWSSTLRDPRTRDNGHTFPPWVGMNQIITGV